MRILLTGAAGFLGWHMRLRLHALTDHEVIPVTRDSWTNLTELAASVDAVIHLAGVNRGSDAEVQKGNAALAGDVAAAIRANSQIRSVVFANSIQDGNGSPYGEGKRQAADLLRAAAESRGSCGMTDVKLPNIFGEHGRPRYNSFVATFVHAVAAGETPQIQDNDVSLLHAQDAAQSLIDALEEESMESRPSGTPLRVQEVWDLLTEFESSYSTGEIPDLSTKFRIELFNTYRAALFPWRYPFQLTPHTDPRGRFVETIRCRGGEGQASVSTTHPGTTRGEHYHLSKVERFAVLQGEAVISLRRMFTTNVIDFPVSGDRPTAIDMPVGWVHNITNTGTDILLTQFWAHQLFRPEAPDTFAQKVRLHTGAEA